MPLVPSTDRNSQTLADTGVVDPATQLKGDHPLAAVMDRMRAPPWPRMSDRSEALPHGEYERSSGQLAAAFVELRSVDQPCENVSAKKCFLAFGFEG